MCGIFALLNNVSRFSLDHVQKQFEKGKGRGPEFSKLSSVMLQTVFGFHRLAINGLNQESNQPIMIDNVTLICNGEIYNYKELYKMMDVIPKTDSDCEVIVHLYIKYGIEHTLQMLDGVFAFALLDNRFLCSEAKIYIARDPFGIRPLYIMKPTISFNNKLQNKENGNANNIFGIASEIKMLSEMCSSLNENNKQLNQVFKRICNINYDITQFAPGTYSIFELPYESTASWHLKEHQIAYHKTGFYLPIPNINNAILQNIQFYLYRAVEKRCCTTQRPIACLLSGGLDSSLITALVMEYHTLHNLPPVETYSIGLAGSEDLKNAKVVAEYLGTKHTEILLTEQDFLDAIPDVIYAIESYDTTSVRASIGNWLLGKYIASHSEAKVIFNGDGSDELTGGYLYMSCAPDAIEFDKECRRLLHDIHAFDVLRSDKSISSHGLEPRTPFLDRGWVQYYLSIPPELRFNGCVVAETPSTPYGTCGNTEFSLSPTTYGNGGSGSLQKEDSVKMEKYLLRSAFCEKNYLNSKLKPLLPESIIWRKKEAFSDGVSKQTRSLYEIIKEYTTEQFMENDFSMYPFPAADITSVYENMGKIHPDLESIGKHLMPRTAEQFYYRKIFEKYYPGMGKIVPYFWMPKYVNATDASARTLDIYTVPL